MATTTYTTSAIIAKFNITEIMLTTVDRHIDFTDGSIFYSVKSEHTTERYEVRFNFKHATFTCTCKAGQNGFIHCKSYCKHVRAAKAYALQYRQRENEQARYEATEAAVAGRKAFNDRMAVLEAQRESVRKHGGISILA